MYESGPYCWPAVSPAVSHAVEAVDLAATELAVALAFLLFTEVFLLAEPKGQIAIDFSTGRVCISYASDVLGMCVMITLALKSYRDSVGFLAGSA